MSPTIYWIVFKIRLKLRWPNHILQILKLKTTSNERWPQNTPGGISQQPLIRYVSTFKLNLWGPNQNRKWLVMKKTSDGRWLQNIRWNISADWINGSFSNSKLKIRWPNITLQCLKTNTHTCKKVRPHDHWSRKYF